MPRVDYCSPIWSVLTRRAKPFPLFISCSQTLKTSYPCRRSKRLTLRSRLWFLAIFGRQYSVRLEGARKHLGHPCQKQPSRKTISLDLGKKRSGEPGNPCGRSFQPPMCLLRSAPTITPSVEAFRTERTCCIISERSSRLKLSIPGPNVNNGKICEDSDGVKRLSGSEQHCFRTPRLVDRATVSGPQSWKTTLRGWRIHCHLCMRPTNTRNIIAHRHDLSGGSRHPIHRLGSYQTTSQARYSLSTNRTAV
jgi:hypothetical protein